MGRLIEHHRCFILLIGHSREIVARVNLPCPPKEEILESLESAWPQRTSNPCKADPKGKALCPRDGDQFKMVRECPHPVRDQVIMRKSNVRVAAPREGLRNVAVGYSEAPGKLS